MSLAARAAAVLCTLLAAILPGSGAESSVRVAEPYRQTAANPAGSSLGLNLQLGFGVMADSGVDHFPGGSALLELAPSPFFAATLRVDHSRFEESNVAVVFFPSSVSGSLTTAEFVARAIDLRKAVSPYCDLGLGGFWGGAEIDVAGRRFHDQFAGGVMSFGIGVTWRPTDLPIGCFTEGRLAYFLIEDGGHLFPVRAGVILAASGGGVRNAATARGATAGGERDSLEAPRGRSISTVRSKRLR